MPSGRRIFSLSASLWLALGVSLGIFAGRAFRTNSSDRPDPVRESTHVEPATLTAAGESSAPAPTPSPSASPQPVLETLRKWAADKSGDALGTCLNLIRQLPAADCPEALNLFREWPSAEREMLRHAIARQWARLDPEGALRMVWNRRHADIANTLSSEAARELVKRDPDGALARLSESAPLLQQVLLTRHVITALAERDPARAAAFLLTRREFTRDENIFKIVAAQWAQINAEAAIAWASSVPDGKARRDAVNGAWIAWAVKDPAAAGAAILSSPTARFDRGIIQTLARTWSENNPDALLTWIEHLPDAASRESAWSSFQVDIQKVGADAALALIQRLPSDKQGEAAAHMVSELARSDLAAARAWVERLPEGLARSQALRPIIEEWAPLAPEQAAAYLSGLPASAARTDLLRRTAGIWALQDTSAATQWLQSMPAGSERDELATSAVQVLREIAEPARAVQLLEFVENPAQREKVVQEIVRLWGQTDGAAAAQWLTQLPESDAPANAYHSLARQWAFVDRDATMQWMKSLPSGASRDSAIGAFVESIDGYDAGLATAWATAIGNPAERDANTRSAFDRWLQSDAASARNWLQQVELDHSLRAQLVQASDDWLRRVGK